MLLPEIEEKQSSNQIQNKLIGIYGKPGQGKTFLGVCLANFYPIIYSNINIKKDGKLISNPLLTMQDVVNIPYHEKKGLIILDELGVNGSSRRSMSKNNEIFTQLAMLGRKKNKDIIIIAQLKRSMDIILKELSEYSITMNNLNGSFEGMIERVSWKSGKEFLIGYRKFDLISYSQLCKLEYSTLDNSKII